VNEPWYLSEDEKQNTLGEYTIFRGHGGFRGRDNQVCMTRLLDDARLIAEAGTVLHETGMTPKELAERVTQLTSANETLRIEKGASLAAAEMSDRITTLKSELAAMTASRDHWREAKLSGTNATLSAERAELVEVLKPALSAINAAYGITGDNQFINAAVAARDAIAKLEVEQQRTRQLFG
jgi:hypothetical protein